MSTWEQGHVSAGSVLSVMGQRKQPVAVCDTNPLRFVLQPPSVPDYPPADGYAFSNTVYKRGPLLDQGAAVAAFKQTVSRHVDR